MATIPVNPERRDPGYLRKKADIGLSSVDNVSTTDIINTVAKDVKLIGNVKTLSKSIPSGTNILGILRTSESSGHVNFVTGLFDASEKELAQFSVDFSFSTTEDSTGSTSCSFNYTTQTPESDPYLKYLHLMFTLVGSRVYVWLQTSALIRFDRLGTNLIEWTEGTELCDYAVESTVRGGKTLGSVKLDVPRTTSYSAYQESLPVYDKSGSRVLISSKAYSQTDLDLLDYPTINGVPFIAKKGMTIAGGTNARNITVTAKHSGSTLNSAGGHDWEVLNNFRAIRYENPYETVDGQKVLDSDTFNPTTVLVSNTEKSYESLGLSRPAGYSRFKGSFKTFTEASKTSLNWLESIGEEDTDVITVGLFKEYMNFMISQVLQNVKYLDQKEIITYSDWAYTFTYSTEPIPSSGNTSSLKIAAERTKTTITYSSSGEIVDTKTETETGASSDMKVTGLEDGIEIVNSTETPDTWNITFPKNTTLQEKNYHIAIYHSNILAKILTYTQEKASDVIISEEYEIFAYTDKVVSGNSKNSTAEVDYFVQITKTKESGEVLLDYYRGSDVTLSSVPSITSSFVEDGVYTTVYPENSSTEEKSYILTLGYKNATKQLNVTQTVKTDKEVVIGTNYIFTSDLKTLEFVDNKSLNIGFTSKSYKQGSLAKGTVLTDVSFEVESKPDWITCNIDGQTGEFTVEETDKYRVGYIVLLQSESSRRIVIPVFQEKTVVSSGWKIYYSHLDCSSVLLTGGTRTLDIIYAKETTYLDKSIGYQFYSGEDINVNVNVVSGPGKATASYNSSLEKWIITFQETTSPTEFNINTVYQNISSATYEISQESALISSEYSFSVSECYPEYKNIPSLVTQILSNTEIKLEPNAGLVTVTVVSKKINHYADGSTKTVLVPFRAQSKTSYVFINGDSITTNDKSLIFSVNENLGDIRYDYIRLIQEESEKSLDLSIVQNKSTSSFLVRVKFPDYRQDITIPEEGLGIRTYTFPYSGTYDPINNQFPFVGVASLGEFHFDNSSNKVKFYVDMIQLLNGVELDFPTDDPTIYYYDLPDSSWADVNIDPGDENELNLLEVSVTDNKEGSDREYSFSLNPGGGEACITFKFTQEKGAPYININGTSGDTAYVLEATRYSQSIHVWVDSNYPCTVTNNSSWITVNSDTLSAGETELDLTLNENNSDLERSFDLYLDSEGGIRRTLRVIQTFEGNYIDVVDFRSEDLMVTMSDWKNLLVIPINSNCPYFIDSYSSDWLKVALSEKGSSTVFPEPNYIEDYKSLEAAEGTSYLYITTTTNTKARGVVSLSYYDYETQQIVRGRNIYVYYYPDLGVLPYGTKNNFVFGESQTVDLYAFTKDLSDLRLYLNTSKCSQEFLEKFNPEDFVVKNPKNTGKLNKLTITIPYNLSSKYLSAEFTLGTSDSELDYLSEMTNHTLPAYDLYQYPELSFDCYYKDSGTKTINVSSDGSDSIEIQAFLINSLGFWEIYGESLPGWISIKDNISATSDSTITLIIEPNYTTESRSSEISFWCDSNKNTIRTITINQEEATTRSSMGYTNDYSLITASSSSRYVLLYGVSSVSSTKTIESDGTIRSTDDSIITEVSEYNNALKVTYSILNANTYYHKDIYKVLTLVLKDGTQRQFIIRNPRSQEIAISISASSNTYMNSDEFTYATNTFNISSNIGLTGFRRETNDTFKTTYLDSGTSETINGTYSNQFLNSSKLFYKTQIMDNLMLKNMDVLPGYTYNHPIILPKKTSGKNRGIVIYNEYNVPYSTMDSVTDFSYDVTLSSTVGTSTWISVRAYDGLTIDNQGSEYEISYEQSDLMGTVGSLGRLYIEIKPTSDNNTAAKKYLGYFKVNTSSGVTRTIYIYQDTSIYSPVGVTSLYKGGTGVILVDAGGTEGKKNANIVYTESSNSWDVEFIHEYSNWMLLNVSSEEDPGIKFGGGIYSSDFGNGGNSGTATVILAKETLGCKYKTNLNLAASKPFSTDNASFELSRIAKYGVISTYTTGNINLEENARSYIDIYTRPNAPFFTVLTDDGVKIKDSSGNVGTGTLVSKRHQSNPGSTTNPGTIWFPVIFEVTSNYINTCKDYVGKTIVMDKKEISVTSMFDVFLDRLSLAQIKYKISGVESTITLDKSKTIKNESSSSIRFYQDSTSGSGRVIIVSDLSTIPEEGNLVLYVNDFTIDTNKYYPSKGLTKLEIPIKFEI